MIRLLCFICTCTEILDITYCTETLNFASRESDLQSNRGNYLLINILQNRCRRYAVLKCVRVCVCGAHGVSTLSGYVCVCMMCHAAVCVCVCVCRLLQVPQAGV